MNTFAENEIKNAGSTHVDLVSAPILTSVVTLLTAYFILVSINHNQFMFF